MLKFTLQDPSSIYALNSCVLSFKPHHLIKKPRSATYLIKRGEFSMESTFWLHAFVNTAFSVYKQSHQLLSSVLLNLLVFSLYAPHAPLGSYSLTCTLYFITSNLLGNLFTDMNHFSSYTYRSLSWLPSCKDDLLLRMTIQDQSDIRLQKLPNKYLWPQKTE